MNKKLLAWVMDPIERIKPEKDTSFAMMLEAKRRGYQIAYIADQYLFIEDGVAKAQVAIIDVTDQQQNYFKVLETKTLALAELPLIFMRKDPPVDEHYLYLTHVLGLAESQGAKVVNKPQSLRDANEKLFTTFFAECCPETLISSDMGQLREFIQKLEHVVLKPLNGMGGASIFIVKKSDPNIAVILENLTEQNQTAIMAQAFIPEIAQGDKRILLIKGEAVPYALARIPSPNDSRGNIARGASVKGLELSDRERWICQQLAPVLKAKQLDFVGIDVIGDYLTEINVTSPTCVRELDKAFNLNICGELFDGLGL